MRHAHSFAKVFVARCAAPYIQRTGKRKPKVRDDMTISTGAKLPDATLVKMGEKGPEAVPLADKLKGRKVALFAVPGAFTPTCHSAHVPSFIRTKDQFAAKGVDEIICISVNDPFVMKAWSEATGATAAGITMLSDASSEFTKAIGMNFDAPPAGLVARSKRYAMLVEDGVVSVFHPEESPGTCDISGGEALLAAI
jgi:cytochrome c peroxidase